MSAAMTLIAGLIGGVGIMTLISRKTILGVLIGTQILILGATLTFVWAGISSGAQLSGHIFALLIVMGGVGQLGAGYALAIRMFYLKNTTHLEEIRSLKQ